ncbi:RHS repeat-associated core domain-containing protein [Agarivorans litoreus]|uniref:RHS repeat-associated core domain-containing protein n=1 Tax=Agarivorans litoreus TaxID=1510455 RepID=UPI001C7DBEB5|nr:RHS repeat-associated core domain-containing protein [Agarivorans litoreus]
MILGENSILARYGRVNDISHAYTNRGYTGHEMLAGVGLIHMNGRIYDAEVGRFLQADPHIQAPNNAQNYNRYSYVLNNPMSYTDPSGYFFKKIGKFFKKYGRVIAAAVVSYITYGAASKWAAAWASSSLVQGAAAGAIAGAVGGYVGTGTPGREHTLMDL